MIDIETSEATMSRTAILELVDRIWAYLIAIGDPFLVPFIGDWPAEPFHFRSVDQRALPVMACLPAVASRNDPKCEKLVRLLE